MQEELAELQAELHAFDDEDGQNLESKKAARNWKEFKKKGEAQPRRLELIREIRTLMKEYSEMKEFMNYRFESFTDYSNRGSIIDREQVCCHTASRR